MWCCCIIYLFIVCWFGFDFCCLCYCFDLCELSTLLAYLLDLVGWLRLVGFGLVCFVLFAACFIILLISCCGVFGVLLIVCVLVFALCCFVGFFVVWVYWCWLLPFCVLLTVLFCLLIGLRIFCSFLLVCLLLYVACLLVSVAALLVCLYWFGLNGLVICLLALLGGCLLFCLYVWFSFGYKLMDFD